MKRILLAIALFALAAPASAQLVITPAPVPACTTGQTVVYNGSTWVCQPVAATPISDATALLQNGATSTKQFRFDLTGLTAATTRVWWMPDYDVDLRGSFANRVVASGSSGAGPITLRSLVAADIPSLDASKITTGTFANSVTTATSANTASAIVARDSNGDFTARYITATSFLGNATSATTAGSATTVTNGVYTSGSYTDPSWLTITKSKVGLSAVENTALSTWAGTTNVTTLGTVATGTWNATAIAWAKVDKTGSVLDDIGDVTITTPTQNQILKWSGTAWINADPAAASGHGLLSSTHGDTSVGSPTRGALIVGNATPAWQALALGASGTVLKSNGADASWQTLNIAALSDGANVAKIDSPNVFTANQSVTKTRPSLDLLDPGSGNTKKSRVLVADATSVIYLGANTYYDGSWELDSTGTAGGLLGVGPSSLAYYALSAGANPRTPTSAFSVTSGGNGYFAGSLNLGAAFGISAGDLSVSRSATTGAIYFGSNGSNYIYNDGTYFQFTRNLKTSGGVFESGRSTAQGEFIDGGSPTCTDPFSLGTWTSMGTKAMFGYTLIGHQMTLYFNWQGMASSNSPQACQITIPGGFTAYGDTRNSALVWDANAAGAVGQVFVNSNYIRISRFPDGSRFSSSGNIHLIGEVTFQVQ